MDSDSEVLQVHHHVLLCLSPPGRGVGLLGLGSLALLGLLLCCLSPCAGPPGSGVGLFLLWLLACLLCCVPVCGRLCPCFAFAVAFALSAVAADCQCMQPMWRLHMAALF